MLHLNTVFHLNTLLSCEKTYSANGFSRLLINLMASSRSLTGRMGSRGPNISSCITFASGFTSFRIVGAKHNITSQLKTHQLNMFTEVHDRSGFFFYLCSSLTHRCRLPQRLYCLPTWPLSSWSGAGWWCDRSPGRSLGCLCRSPIRANIFEQKCRKTDMLHSMF